MRKHIDDSYEKTWIEEIDILRGFAILAVIAIHTSTNFSKITNLNYLVISNMVIDIFSQFGVPLFIFISGFVLAIKYYDMVPLTQFFIKRIRSTIPQYLIFSILYISFFAILNDPPSSSEIFYKILTASSAIHMWFFLTIIGFYIFYPIIIKIYRYFEEQEMIHSFLMLTFFIQISWSISVLIMESNGYDPSVVYLAKRVFIPYLFYFISGIYVSKNLTYIKDHIRSIKMYKPILFSILILMTMIILFFWIIGQKYYVQGLDYFYYMSPLYFIILIILEVFYYLAIFVLLFEASYMVIERKNILGSILLTLGRHSFGIYLIHFLFITMIIAQLKQFNIYSDNWIFYPVLFLTTIILSLFSVKLIHYLPFSELIVGGAGHKIKN